MGDYGDLQSDTLVNPSIDLTLRRVTEAVTASGFVNVHDPRLCVGEHCVFHRPSFHRMLFWPKNLRNGPFDSVPGLVERICPHGVGHPDPDSARYFERNGTDAFTHGCDGCCGKRNVMYVLKTLRERAGYYLNGPLLVDRITRTEMSEGGLAQAPHCCAQGQCWAHSENAWCRCTCRWCRIARLLRRTPRDPKMTEVD